MTTIKELLSGLPKHSTLSITNDTDHSVFVFSISRPSKEGVHYKQMKVSQKEIDSSLIDTLGTCLRKLITLFMEHCNDDGIIQNASPNKTVSSGGAGISSEAIKGDG